MINGVINVYKEKGYTSHDVVAKLRGILKQKKIGHTGTLDPEAEGVLPVCLGKATKLCDLLTDKRKTYEAVLHLGIVTDTQDMTGRILEEHPVLCSEEDTKKCIMGFQGEQEQIPPMYSALKINGKKLYELAREGKEVERKPRKVCFYYLEILEMKLPYVRFRVICSKGTYIRTLCHDMGQKLGCGGCMESLVRTQVERFHIEESMKLEEIEEAVKEGRLQSQVISVEEMFSEYKEIVMPKQFDKMLHNGNGVPCTGKETDAVRVRMYDSMHRFTGVYVYRESKKQYMPLTMFYDQEDFRENGKERT